MKRMRKYGISLIKDGNTIIVDALYFTIENGFICFYRDTEGFDEIFASYACGNVYHCVEQPEYTEQFILDRINYYNFELQYLRANKQ